MSAFGISEFANFGRILTETVECFGQSPEERMFYHGLLGSYFLHSVQGRFLMPTSMTCELSVMAYYCSQLNLERYSQGLILGLSAAPHSDLKYFDCKFLSDFSNESEVIFLGGKSRLHFDAIYDLKSLRNYQYYLAAIGMLQDCFLQAQPSGYSTGSLLNESVYNTFRACVYKQTLERTDKIPSQIEYYLNEFCNSRKSMTIHMAELTKSAFLKTLLTECQLLLKVDEQPVVYSISVDMMLRLFPNAMAITLVEPILDAQCHILRQLHHFLQDMPFYGSDLQRIELVAPSFAASAMQKPHEIISAHAAMFFKLGWTIKMPEETPGGDNEHAETHFTIQILKQSLSPRRSHNKSRSTPNVSHGNEDGVRLRAQRGPGRRGGGLQKA